MNAETMIESLRYYQRSMARELGQRGIEVKDVLVGPYANDVERFETWLVESLLTGLTAAINGNWKLASRCYAQANEYKGRLGFFPGPHVSDACGQLRNAIESQLQGS